MSGTLRSHQFKEIRTERAPAPVGPYSQALEHLGLVFCSGQIPLDPTDGKIVGSSAADQVVQVLKNIRAVLNQADLDFANIIKVTIFMTDLSEFAAVNAIYEKEMAGHRPARSTVQVSALPKGAAIEIECIACRS